MAVRRASEPLAPEPSRTRSPPDGPDLPPTEQISPRRSRSPPRSLKKQETGEAPPAPPAPPSSLPSGKHSKEPPSRAPGPFSPVQLQDQPDKEQVGYKRALNPAQTETSMCKGLSYLPSSCLEKANKMRVKLGHLAETHQKNKAQDGKAVQDLESLLTSKSGLQAFQAFLRSEYSEENLKFWLACEDYKDAPSKTKASSICSQFINPDAPQEVNLDAETREALLSVMGSLGADAFNTAQQRIYSLMAKDSFPRFLRSAQSAHTLKAF